MQPSQTNNKQLGEKSIKKFRFYVVCALTNNCCSCISICLLPFTCRIDYFVRKQKHCQDQLVEYKTTKTPNLPCCHKKIPKKTNATQVVIGTELQLTENQKPKAKKNTEKQNTQNTQSKNRTNLMLYARSKGLKQFMFL